MQIFGPRLSKDQQLCVIVGLTYVIENFLAQARRETDVDTAAGYVRAASGYIETYREFTRHGAHRRWARRNPGLWVKQSCDVLLEVSQRQPAP